MKPIVRYLPCIILDTEGSYITIGLLNSIERIDHIDYRFYYEWRVLIYNGNIEFRNRPDEGTESNHLESWKLKKIKNQEEE